MPKSRRVPLLRAMCFLIFLFAFAGVAAAADLAVYVPELAGWIESNLAAGQPLALTVVNHSSLSPADADFVRRELSVRLAAHLQQPPPAGASAAQATVTLAESQRSYVWVVELVSDGNRDVHIVEFKRPRDSAAISETPQMLVRSQKVIEQEQPILDFAVLEASANAPLRLLVLEPGTLAAYSLEQGRAQPRERLLVPPAAPPQRDLRGGLLITRQSIQVVLPGVGCYGRRQQSLTLTCESLSTLASPWDESGATTFRLRIPAYSVARFEIKGKWMELEAGSDGLARLYKSEDGELSATFSGWGSELTALKTGCGRGWQILTSRASDWTERDAVQAVEIAEKQAVAVSPALEMDGPVIKLHASESQDAAFAVVRNLQTRRYEAYVLSLSCSH